MSQPWGTGAEPQKHLCNVFCFKLQNNLIAGLLAAVIKFPLQRCNFQCLTLISSYQNIPEVRWSNQWPTVPLPTKLFGMQEELSAAHSHPWSASCWHLAANITAYNVHTDVNTHKEALTPGQTHSPVSVWENADVFHLCIAATSLTSHRTKLQKDCEETVHTHTHTHSGYASQRFGSEPGLQSNPVSRVRHAAGADGKQERSSVQAPRWGWEVRRGMSVLQLQNATNNRNNSIMLETFNHSTNLCFNETLQHIRPDLMGQHRHPEVSQGIKLRGKIITLA